jgi:hypothetical protein
VQYCNGTLSNSRGWNTAHGLIIFPHSCISCYAVPILRKPTACLKLSSLQAIKYFSFILKLLSFLIQYVIMGRHAEGVKKAYLFSLPNRMGHHHKM